MHIHLTEKRKFLIVPSFPAGVAKDWRIHLGDQDTEVATDLVVRKLQSSTRGEFSNLNLGWYESIRLPHGYYENCRIRNATLVGGGFSKCDMEHARLVVEGRVTLTECLLHRADLEAGGSALCALKNCNLDSVTFSPKLQCHSVVCAGRLSRKDFERLDFHTFKR